MLAATGVVFAFAQRWWVLALVALTGALSTEVVESGPFTSLEQAMLATELSGAERLRGFGIYNAVGRRPGRSGARRRAPRAAPRSGPARPSEQRWFLVFVPVALAGAFVARSLSDPGRGSPSDRRPRTARGSGRRARWWFGSRGLFALDSFGGRVRRARRSSPTGSPQRFGASLGTVGVVFFAVGVLQTGSFLVAPRLAERFGLLRTMVFTHLPSNVLLAAIAFAPNLGVAVALLLARTALSQMDVPTRQAYVMALVDPTNAPPPPPYTNTARYLTRPIGPALAGAGQSIALWRAASCSPGRSRARYDLVLWRWFRTVPPRRTRLRRGVAVIVCLRTVAVPPDERDRYLAWIAEGRAVREAHGILAELVLEPTDRRRRHRRGHGVAEPRGVRRVDRHPRTRRAHRIRRAPSRRVPADHPLRRRRRLPQPRRPPSNNHRQGATP